MHENLSLTTCHFYSFLDDSYCHFSFLQVVYSTTATRTPAEGTPAYLRQVPGLAMARSHNFVKVC